MLKVDLAEALLKFKLGSDKMSKFIKKLDQARQAFFSGGKNAGKKMKHDATGNLDDDESLTDANNNYLIPSSQLNISNNFLSSQVYQNQVNNLYNTQSLSSVTWIGRNNIISGNWNNSQQGVFSSKNCLNPSCIICNGISVQFVNVLTKTNPLPQLLRDPIYNNDFGWRCWSWCKLEKKLYSPIQNTEWPQAENHAHKYDESSMVRGVAGIHAKFVPEKWQELECPDGIDFIRNSLPTDYLENLYGTYYKDRIEITGLVERFGKYVEGTDGWRSEWAIIRKLYAPSSEVGLDLERAFPEVEVIYKSEPNIKQLAAE